MHRAGLQQTALDLSTRMSQRAASGARAASRVGGFSEDLLHARPTVGGDKGARPSLHATARHEGRGFTQHKPLDEDDEQEGDYGEGGEHDGDSDSAEEDEDGLSRAAGAPQPMRRLYRRRAQPGPCESRLDLALRVRSRAVRAQDPIPVPLAADAKHVAAALAGVHSPPRENPSHGDSGTEGDTDHDGVPGTAVDSATSAVVPYVAGGGRKRSAAEALGESVGAGCTCNAVCGRLLMTDCGLIMQHWHPKRRPDGSPDRTTSVNAPTNTWAAPSSPTARALR